GHRSPLGKQPVGLRSGQRIRRRGDKWGDWRGGVSHVDVGVDAMLAGVLANRLDVVGAEVAELLLADPFDSPKTLEGRRPPAGHVLQRGVAEDHVMREPPLLGRLAPESPEVLEESLINSLPWVAAGDTDWRVDELARRLEKSRRQLPL